MNKDKNYHETDAQSKDNSQGKAEQDTQYDNSFEVTNPNPSTATPAVPVEMPER